MRTKRVILHILDSEGKTLVEAEFETDLGTPRRLLCILLLLQRQQEKIGRQSSPEEITCQTVGDNDC